MRGQDHSERKMKRIDKSCEVTVFNFFACSSFTEDFFPSPPKMEENTVRQVHTAVLSMYKGDHRATQWLNAFGRSKVCSILTREM